MYIAELIIDQAGMTEAQELNAYPGKTAQIFFCGLRAINKLKKDWVGEAEFSLGSISLSGGILGLGIMGCQ